MILQYLSQIETKFGRCLNRHLISFFFGTIKNIGMGKTIFNTVESTYFDGLISAIDSLEFIELGNKKGYDKIIVQIGKYTVEIKNLPKYYNYVKPSEILQFFQQSDLVIGHADAGTIMEVLQLGKPLFVVVNDTLMENHQTELARELQKRNLLTFSGVSNFMEVFESTSFQPKTKS
jgi:beta-1,4-N-acetylglucosaminyltransferase